MNKEMKREPFNYQLNNITFWFPLLKQSLNDMKNLVKYRKIDERMLNYFNLPKTALVFTDVNFWIIYDKIEDYYELKKYRRLKEEICNKCYNIGEGEDVFFRSGQRSLKKLGFDKCFLKKHSYDCGDNILNLFEIHLMSDMSCFVPLDSFAIRKKIDVEIIGEVDSFKISEEYRFFINNNKTIGYQKYWGESQIQNLKENEIKNLIEISNFISDYFNGYWSIDFLKSKDGKRYVIDMGIGERSYKSPNFISID